MTLPSLPPEGSTDWYAWAQGVHDRAAAVSGKADTADLEGVVNVSELSDPESAPSVALRAAFGAPEAVLSAKKDFGAKGDGRTLADGAGANGSTAFTSASAGFTAEDVGKQILIMVTADTVSHVTTIAAVDDETTVTLADPLPAELSGTRFTYGTDDTAAIQAAIDAAANAGGGQVFFDLGFYFVTTLVHKARVALASAFDNYGYSHPSPVTLFGYGDGATVIDTPAEPINGISIRGITVQGAADWQAARAGVGIRWRHVNWSNMSGVLVKGTRDQGVLIEAGIAPALYRLFIVNALMNRTRATDAGALELVACTDAQVTDGEFGCGQGSATTMTTGSRTRAVLIKGNGNFFSGCVAELADAAWEITGRGNQFTNCRGDLSFMEGWRILSSAQSGRNSLSGCRAWNNGRAATNTYAGIKVTSLRNTFAGIENQQDGSGTWNASSKYAIEDTSTPTTLADRNQYAAISGSWGTALLKVDGLERNHLPKPFGDAYRPVAGHYAAPVRGRTTTATPAANLVYCQWLPLDANVTVDRIGVEVTTGTASTEVRLGIYAPDPVTGQPGPLILDAGTVATTATGAAEITVSQALPTPGVWLAVVRQTATGAALRFADTTLPGPLIPAVDLMNATNAAMCGYIRGGISGALPTSFGSTTPGSYLPIVAVRFA